MPRDDAACIIVLAMPRHIAAFYALAFGFTWLCQLPALLASRGAIVGPMERFLPLSGLGGLGPLVAAVVMGRLDGGVGAVFRPLLRWRVNVAWYAVALFGVGALFVAGRAVYGLLGGHDGGPYLYLPVEPERMVALAVFPFGEEVGWRGYAMPRLQERVGALRASVVHGLLWALWHLFMFQIVGVSLAMLLALVPFFVAGSVLFTWVYNRTGGSLLLAVLAHAGAHLNNTNRPLPGNFTPAAIHTAALVVVAVVLVARDPSLGSRRAD